MRFNYRTKISIVLVALFLAIGFVRTEFAIAQNTAQQAKPKAKSGFTPFQVDPRVQKRTYHFGETNEDLEYLLFVSSKVSKGRKAPLIVTLHGLGAGPQFMLTFEETYR